MQSLQITQPWQAATSEHMEIWSVKLCFLHLLPANALSRIASAARRISLQAAIQRSQTHSLGACVFCTKPSQAVPGRARCVKTQPVPSSSPFPPPKMVGSKKNS